MIHNDGRLRIGTVPLAVPLSGRRTVRTTGPMPMRTSTRTCMTRWVMHGGCQTSVDWVFVVDHFDASRRLVETIEREGTTIPLHLSRFSYTPETWGRLINHPEDRGKPPSRKSSRSYASSSWRCCPQPLTETLPRARALGPRFRGSRALSSVARGSLGLLLNSSLRERCLVPRVEFSRYRPSNYPTSCTMSQTLSGRRSGLSLTSAVHVDRVGLND